MTVPRVCAKEGSLGGPLWASLAQVGCFANLARGACAEAEAERDAAQRVMSAHRCYRHRCTCTMTEQDPWCPTHPIVDHIGPGGAAVREGGE